jgi:hypothetical protein
LSAALAAGRGWAALLFVAGVVTIFAGFLVHMSQLSLGRRGRRSGPRGRMPWKLSAMALVAVSMVVLGCWLPGPLYQLIQQTASSSEVPHEYLLPELQPPGRSAGQFSGRFTAVHAPRANEVYFHGPMEVVAGFCAQLYRKWDGRLVSLFADDARADGGGVSPVLRFRARCGARVFHPARAGAGRQTGVHLAHRRRPRGELAGARSAGPVRLETARPSESAALRAARRLAGGLSAAQGFRPAHRAAAVPGRAAQVPRGRGRGRFPGAGRSGARRHHRARAISCSAWPASRCSTCSCACSTRTRAPRNCSRACPWPRRAAGGEHLRRLGFAHATAFCHAVERAAGVEAPPRARALRTICLELERLYNHLGDIGAICTDVAFTTANMHAMRLKERGAARERAAHRQPPAARHGLPRRRALRFRPAQRAALRSLLDG